jgi:hypothetical protein
MHSLWALALTIFGATSVHGCTRQGHVTYTFYGYPDNSPPGAAIAYDCGRGQIAGGTGTFADPLTMASAKGELTQCEVVYAPYLRKYLRYEDECGQCEKDWAKNPQLWHIDVWTGSSTVNGGQDQINCEDQLTATNQWIIRQPRSTLPVDCTCLRNLGYYGYCCCNLHVLLNRPTDLVQPPNSTFPAPTHHAVLRTLIHVTMSQHPADGDDVLADTQVAPVGLSFLPQRYISETHESDLV